VKRRISLLVASVALVAAAGAAPVSAGAGGVPNENANCQAQWQRFYQNAGYGNPSQLADTYFGGDVKAYKAFLDAICGA
jgi:hypothetical protein